MTRVLVSGGTGFVGRFIVEHLLQAGYEVVIGGRTRAPNTFFSGPVGFVPLSLDPTSDHSAAFGNVQCFVHAAFQHIPGRYRGGEGDDPESFRRANLDGSVRLFETAREQGVGRCIFLSSRAVYGTHSAGAVLSEGSTCHPESLYGALKLAAERQLELLGTDNFRTASLRVTGVYGAPGNGASHKWQALFDDYLQGRPVAPRAGTEVHGDDVAAAVRLVLEAETRRSPVSVFNVSDILVDNSIILEIVRQITGCTNDLPEPAALTEFNAMDCGRLRALGWTPGGLPRLHETIEKLLG
ncbi:NAD-dependent epimerase/dehydratase family protein [Ensifer adhaerens]|jgi:nucleoside-diphosphate-sugar epimerase|uniref:NAD-dependent epimerase/dehydratase family protein n=1 Tax=Ensifer adhaerens TaxID=106592 RepID=UPI0009681F40|nr:NAD(P)-dependent oxidoreductase [Ensifer adhaerens]OKP79847.1 UDP-glucose 4-epimerase [Ensifer adhaerens]